MYSPESPKQQALQSFSPASGSPSLEHFSTDSNEEHRSQDQKLLSPPSKLQKL